MAITPDTRDDLFDRQYPMLGHVGKSTLVLSAIKSAVPFMSTSLVSLIKSMCKKFQDKDLLHILVFFLCQFLQ